MTDAHLIYLVGFGLGKTERAPWRQDDQDVNRYWDLEANRPVNRVDDGMMQPAGLVKVYSPQAAFALHWMNGEVKLSCRVGQASFIATLSSDTQPTEQVYASRGIFEGTARVMRGAEQVFTYTYPVFRLAEFFEDALLIENLDFFRYIERQQKRNFDYFISRFSGGRSTGQDGSHVIA